MIVWLNGTFGAGKSTVSGHLVTRCEQLRHFDPECIGYMLANNLAGHTVTDFQQYPSWRRLVPVVAEVIKVTGQHLVAAQTVLVESYWREIHHGLADRGHGIFHVVLSTPMPTLSTLASTPTGRNQSASDPGVTATSRSTRLR